MPDSLFISVAVLAPLEERLTYSVSSEHIHQIKPGQRVLVPLGRRKAVGVVLQLEVNTPEASIITKPIEALLEETPLFTAKHLELFQWAADYYLAPIGEVIRCALPPNLAKVSQVKQKRPRKMNWGPENTHPAPLKLSQKQTEIVEAILPKTRPLSFQTHLLHGVTGSGKTEIYLACLEKTLEVGKQAICLVPEIGLTPQALDRYQSRFGSQVAIYHSELSEGQREQLWQACANGKISILLGTRSALFAPFRNLGLWVVDEEQDGSYKQEDRVRYQARDLSIVRAKLENIPIILGSATPSLESYFNAQSQKFMYHRLDERFGLAQLPKITEVDLKQKNNSSLHLFSPSLLQAIEKRLSQNEQTLLFLNRRGFAHFLLCNACGFIAQCPNCDLSLTLHQKKKYLSCHYCDYHQAIPQNCPTCKNEELEALGSGTEKIENELKGHFPNARIARMDRDTTSHKGSHEAILSQLKNQEIDILVGTQMIAKGHDYPNVTLVGILLADSQLHQPDFRAAELTFQMITQVAGRAGRGDKAGEVVVQSYSGEHYSVQSALKQDAPGFYQQELNHRQEVGYPPFQRLILFRLQGIHAQRVKEASQTLKYKLEMLIQQKKLQVELLGPAPCLIERLRNLYRWQILVKSSNPTLFKHYLRQEVLAQSHDWLPNAVRLVVDVDPMEVV